MRRVKLAAVVAAEERQDEQEEIQQIEIDLHRRDYVILLPELATPENAPRVEHEQTTEDQHADGRDPQTGRGTRHEHVDHARDDEHEQTDHEEAAPRTEIATAGERVE